MLRKLFRYKTTAHWDVIEKETVDEIIFRTNNLRNRLMLELMARPEIAHRNIGQNSSGVILLLTKLER